MAISKRIDKLSNWTSLVTREMNGEFFHSIKPADYVTILAVTQDGKIPLVKQYRMAAEQITLEFPGGLVDEDPEKSALQELEEEVGFTTRKLIFLGEFLPDSGRLDNKMWIYFTDQAEPVENWHPEEGLERVLVDKTQLKDMVLSGQFNHALHLGVIGIASINGLFDL